MPVNAKVGGALRVVAATRVKVGGVWRVAVGRTKVAGVWRVFSAELSVTIDKAEISGVRSGAGFVQTDTATATADGIGPFIYNWTFVSGDPNITITNQPANQIRGEATLGAGEERSAIYRVTVTDTATNKTATDTLGVSCISIP